MLVARPKEKYLYLFDGTEVVVEVCNNVKVKIIPITI